MSREFGDLHDWSIKKTAVTKSEGQTTCQFQIMIFSYFVNTSAKSNHLKI